jgi:hypothetical protein
MKRTPYTVIVCTRYEAPHPRAGHERWEKIPDCSLTQAKRWMRKVGTGIGGAEIIAGEYYRTDPTPATRVINSQHVPTGEPVV